MDAGLLAEGTTVFYSLRSLWFQQWDTHCSTQGNITQHFLAKVFDLNS